jgi:DNA-binding CsgD family transcriptional regulator
VSSTHTITWTHEDDHIAVTFACTAPVGAKCRAVCSEDCETWGPNHQHTLVDGGECMALVYLDAANPEESYQGEDRAPLNSGPIDVTWDSSIETYTWQYSTPALTEATHVQLTVRERQVLGMVADGMTGAGIADKLGLALNTVAQHLVAVRRKYGVRTSLAAVDLARRDGELPAWTAQSS